MKIYWVVPKWPLPIIDGARKAMDCLITPLGMSYSIELIVLLRKDEYPKENDINDLKKRWNLSKISLIQTKASNNNLDRVINFIKSESLTSVPTTYNSYCTNEVLLKFKNIITDPKPFIIGEGLHSCLPAFSLNMPFCYRSHNIESDIWKRAANSTSFPPLKYLLRRESEKVFKLEKELCLKARKIFSISAIDLKSYLDNFSFSSDKIKNIPVAMDLNIIQSKPQRNQFNLLFLGRLDWPPNKDGLKWFLKNIWPKVKGFNQNYYLHIAGSGDSSWLNSLIENENKIIFHGRVADLDEYYSLSDIILSPIFYGSGVRIKVIEASSKGKVTISTSQGVEGIGFSDDDFFRADTKEAWIKILAKLESEIISSKKRNLTKRFLELYSVEQVTKRIAESINDLF